MPLAIELAAARAEALGVSGLLARLEDRFALLAGGDRLAPPRPRSLAATVEWSYRLLCEEAGRAEPGSDGWCAAQFWLGMAADMSADLPGALGHFTAARDALQGRDPSRLLADVLGGRSTALLNTGQLAEGTEEGRRALAVARGLGDPAAEAPALVTLAIAASYRGDHDGAIELIRRLQQTPAGVPAHSRCGSTILVCALIDAGDLAAAESACAAALARCREAGDMTILADLLGLMAYLHVQAGRFQDAAARLREGLQVVMRTGDLFEMTNCLWSCGWLCTATGCYAEAATVWAARDVYTRQHGFIGGSPEDAGREQEALAKIRQALGPARVRAAEERGAAMSLDTAPAPAPAAAGPGLGALSARERELVTLVAQGRTDAQIAAQLYISVRTVGSHLDRIRDKTGCRRRADLTRLALAAGLV
jgi:DNA-binding CsgD family transcriptional regulator